MAFRHGKTTGVLVNAYNLSSYFNSAQTAFAINTAETTTYGTAGAAKTYITGLNDSTVSLAGLFDGATGAVDDVFTTSLGSSTDINFTIAQDGGFTVGRRCLMGQSIMTKYSIDSPVSDVVKVSADFQCDAETRSGVVLADLSAISATSNGTAVDNTTSTTNGGIAILHVPSNTRNGNITVKVQHSSDNSTYADLVTFTVVSSSTTTSERIVVAAGTTVNRYLRATYTVAGSTGSATIAVAFARRY